ncbi:MAG: signal peptidase I [Acidimicrobiaceae bacterium]|nr:signal peptidase I [Acidimicrobiaceae bacterium]
MTETYDAERADSDDAEPDTTPAAPSGEDEPSGLSSGARAFFDWVVVVGVALLVAVLVRTFLLAHFVVDGQSMYSTLAPGDRVFVNKMSYQLHEPGRGDVVVLHEISGAIERDLIKRVIALPGEEIRMENCVVWVDTDPADELPAQRLDEPYLDPTVVTPGNCGSAIEPTVIPDDAVYVMGDNRPGSHDSRALGPVSYDDLVGRAFVVFWPRADWQWL